MILSKANFLLSSANGLMNVWAVLGDNLLPFVPYTCIAEVDAEQTSQIPSEPIEQGRLAAYNVVRQPERVTVTMLFDGAYPTQAGALFTLDQKIASTETCTIISPAKIWRHMALDHYDFSRAQASGASLLTVQASFVEIVAVNLNSQKTAFKPKRATSLSKVNSGQVNTRSAAQDIVNFFSK